MTVPICLVQAIFILKLLAPGQEGMPTVVDREVYNAIWFKPLVVLALTAGGIFPALVGTVWLVEG